MTTTAGVLEATGNYSSLKCSAPPGSVHAANKRCTKAVKQNAGICKESTAPCQKPPKAKQSRPGAALRCALMYGADCPSTSTIRSLLACLRAPVLAKSVTEDGKRSHKQAIGKIATFRSLIKLTRSPARAMVLGRNGAGNRY